MNFCKHIWDIYARVTTDVFQGMPCTKCDAVLELGTMAVHAGGPQRYIEKEAEE